MRQRSGGANSDGVSLDGGRVISRREFTRVLGAAACALAASGRTPEAVIGPPFKLRYTLAS